MIDVILWDIDGTILNFKAAERVAIRACFAKFSLGVCTDEMIARYSAVNDRYWKRLERGELTKAQVLHGRFQEFFASQNISFSEIDAFNHAYQIALGDTICFNDDAYALLSRLRGRVRQYAVTNGTYIAQNRKLEKSGLYAVLDGAFISDKIGIEKPNSGFFEYVFSHIGVYQKDQIMIVGDSLTSDMLGGNNAGIVCCWYNPCGADAPRDIQITYQIQNLNQVEALL